MALPSSHGFSSSGDGYVNTFCWWTVHTQPGSSSSQLMREQEKRMWGQRGQWLLPSALPQKQWQRNHSLKFTFSACFRSDSYRSRLMVAVSMPMGERGLSRNLYQTEIVFLMSGYWMSRWFMPLCMFCWQCYAFLLQYKQCLGGYLIVLSNLCWGRTQDFFFWDTSDPVLALPNA